MNTDMLTWKMGRGTRECCLKVNCFVWNLAYFILGFVGEYKLPEGQKRLALVNNFDVPSSVKVINGDFKLIDSIPKSEIKKLANIFKN